MDFLNKNKKEHGMPTKPILNGPKKVGIKDKLKSFKPTKLTVKVPFFSKVRAFIKLNLKYIRICIYILLVVFIASFFYSQNIGIQEIDNFFRNIDFDYYLGTVFVLVILSLILDIVAWLGTINRLKKYRILRAFKLKYAGEFFVLVLIVSSVLLYLAYFQKHPRYTYTFPNDGGTLLDYSKPIEVKFNVPVRVDKLNPSITPEIDGKWEWEPYLGVDSITRVGKFHIEKTPFPSERFVGYVAGINKLADKREHEYGFIFYSPQIPKIVYSFPSEGQEDVLKDSNFTITFSSEYSDLVDIEATIVPKIDFDISKLGNNELIIAPKQTLAQDTEYTLNLIYKPKSVYLSTGEVAAFSDQRVIEEINFSTTKEPSIDKFTPTGGSVKSTEEISVKFVEPMDQLSVEGNFSIEPNIPGRLEWSEDGLSFIYKTVEPLAKDTQYKVKILSGTRSLSGGSLESNIEYEFKTIGKVNVNGFIPENGVGSVNEYTEIIVDFNQEVDQADAQSKFSMAPMVNGSFRWEGNRMIFKPSSALYLESTYTINISAGVKSVHGIDSDTSFASSFTTRNNSYAFNIPIYYQATSFSCNIYTSIMILAWKGIGADANSLIAEIGYDDRQSGGNWIGNPYKNYIGNSNGSYGYGVYWPPIQQILANRGVSSEVRQNWNVAELAATVQQGNPVIVWRYNGVGGGQDISWTASDGTYVNAFNGMHGSIVTGFTGPADNPTSIYIHDPWLGRLWIDRSTFDAYWSYSGRTGLIVY